MRCHCTGRAPWVILLVGVLLAGASVSASAGVIPDLDWFVHVKQARPLYEADTVTVKFRPGTTPARMAGALAAMNCQVQRPSKFTPGLQIVSVPAGTTPQATVAAFNRRADVEYAELTYIDYSFLVPNDPRYGEQWHFPMINMEAAWDIEPGGKPTTVVAIVDTGIAYEDYTDPNTNTQYVVAEDLDGLNFVLPNDILDGDGHPNDEDGHGTHVCGTIAQQTDNGIGVAGMAYNVSIMPVRSVPGSHQDFSDAVHWAVDNGAHIINYSAGGSASQTKYDAVKYVYDNGVLLIAAMGNDGEFNPVAGYPGRYAETLGVGAVAPSKGLASYSNRGDDVDVVAPGGQQPPISDGVLQNTFDTTPTNMGYHFYQGTSMATPHVTGLAALIHSNGQLTTHLEIRDQIEQTTEDLGSPDWDTTFGWGLIDAEAALNIGDLPPGPATAVNAMDSPGDEGGSITVVWRRSADDGRGRDDVTGYALFRGASSDPAATPFTEVADQTDLPPGTSGWVDTNAIVDGDTYYYFVRTFDASQYVDSTVSPGAVARDDLKPPVVDNLIVRDTQADDGRSMTLSWVGYQGPNPDDLNDLEGFNVYRSEEPFTSTGGADVVRLLPTVGIGTITDPSKRIFIDAAADPDADPDTAAAKPLDLTDYYYAVAGYDEVGNEISAVTPVGPVQCAPNLSLTYLGGLQFISIPALPVDPSPMSVLGLNDPSDAEFARYDTANRVYHTLSQNPDDPFIEVRPGVGFWLERIFPTYIAVAGMSVEDDEFDVPLEIGWNPVGSPYDAEYGLEEVDVRGPLGTVEDLPASNHVRTYGWFYDDFERSYKLLSRTLPNASLMLPARRAMWIYCFDPGTELVFYNNVSTASAALAADPVELDGWQIQLIAATDEASDTDNFIGVTPAAASIGKITSPPLAAGGVDLYFTDGSVGRVAMDYVKSLAPGTVWTAAVESAVPGKTVTLTWPDLSEVPNDVRPVLTDLQTGRSAYMRTVTSYNFVAREAGEPREFEVSFADPAAGPVLTQAATAPNRLGGAEVSFRLMRTADVAVTVRNLAGRVVSKVPVGAGEVGLNRATWDGRSSRGLAVPAGRYVVEITATALDNGERASLLGSVLIAR